LKLTQYTKHGDGKSEFNPWQGDIHFTLYTNTITQYIETKPLVPLNMEDEGLKLELRLVKKEF
jgi:hypothetical protein